MYLEIYPDIIFLLNFILDFILLTILKIISRKDSRRLRRIAAAFIGGIAAAFVGVFPWMNVYVRFIFLNIGTAGVMLVMAFGRMKPAELARQMVSLCLITYSVGGLINTLYYYTDARVALLRIGTTVLGSAKVKWILIPSFLLIPSVLIGGWLLRRYHSVLPEYPVVELFHEGKHLTTKGLMDSGNKLYDPVFHRPVIILEHKLLPGLITPAAIVEIELLKAYLEGESFEDYRPNLSGDNTLHLRMIPYQSIGNKHGMMPGLVIEKVLIHQGTETICNEKVTAAICDNCLSTKEEYHVILHKELLPQDMVNTGSR